MGRFDDACAERVELSLEPLPQWEKEPPDQRKRRMAELLAQLESQAAHATPLGVEAIRNQTTERRPGRKRSARPACHASSTRGREHFKRSYRTFAAAFREASRRWLGGDVHAEFPRGSFRPHVYGGTIALHIQIV